MTVLLYNGHKERIGNKQAKIDKEQANSFFEFLERDSGNWEPDYHIPVYDGYEWKIQLYHSSHKVTIICGSVDNLPQIDEFREHFAKLTDVDELKDAYNYL